MAKNRIKKQRTIDFQGKHYDWSWGGPSKPTKWDISHPSYRKAANIYYWYWEKFMTVSMEYDEDDDEAERAKSVELVKSHQARLMKKKENAEREGLIKDDYDRFFYRFWTELLETAKDDLLAYDRYILEEMWG